MPIDLYPSVAKVKRNGVYQNLPGFVPQTGDNATQSAIANKETSTTAQFFHAKYSYFWLNETLYQADEDIPINGVIAVGTNCHVAVLGDDVSELIDEVKTEDDFVYSIIGIEPVNKWILGGCIKTNTTPISITPVVNQNWKYQIIACSAGDIFNVKITGATSTYRPWAFVDSNYNRLSVAQANSVNTTITAPENSAYVIFNNNMTASGSVAEVTKGIDKIKELEQNSFEIYTLPHGTDFNTLTVNAMYGTYANTSPHYLNVPDEFTYERLGYLAVVNTRTNNIIWQILYIKNINNSADYKVFMRNRKVDSTFDTWTKLIDTVGNSTVDEKLRTEKLISIFHTIGVVGDSLASGQGRINDLDHYHDFYDYSWPQYIKRNNGIEVYNFTESSLTTKTWLTDEDHGWPLASDGSHKCQAYIIALGVNDAKQGSSYVGTSDDIDLNDYTQNADTFYGNYARIISMLRTIEPRSVIFTITNPLASGTVGTNINTAIEYMSTIFSDVYTVTLNPALFGSGSFMDANEVKSHYTPAGYIYVGEYIMQEIANIIYNNPSNFYFTNLIGTQYNTPTIT